MQAFSEQRIALGRAMTTLSTLSRVLYCSDSLWKLEPFSVQQVCCRSVFYCKGLSSWLAISFKGCYFREKRCMQETGTTTTIVNSSVKVLVNAVYTKDNYKSVFMLNTKFWNVLDGNKVRLTVYILQIAKTKTSWHFRERRQWDYLQIHFQ